MVLTLVELHSSAVSQGPNRKGFEAAACHTTPSTEGTGPLFSHSALWFVSQSSIGDRGD